MAKRKKKQRNKSFIGILWLGTQQTTLQCEVYLIPKSTFQVVGSSVLLNCMYRTAANFPVFRAP